MDVLGSPPPALERALLATARTAAADGAPEPPCLAVEGAGGAWLQDFLARPRAVRRRSVAAVASGDGLVAVIRAGVGGALDLPPSSARMHEAFVAADGAPEPPPSLPAEAAAIVLSGAPGRWTILAVRRPELWRRQLGDEALAGFLHAVAEAAGTRAVVIGARAAALPGVSPERAARAAGDVLGAGEVLPGDGVALGSLEVTAGAAISGRDLEDGLDELTGAGRVVAPEVEVPRAVFEIPSGRFLGVWTLGRPASRTAAAGGFVARGGRGPGQRLTWTLETEGGPRRRVPEVLSAAEAAAAGDAAAVRVPGWAAARLGAGSPGGLLLAGLTGEAADRGLPVWVPNVDGARLHVLLGLGVRLWVDGPAVPGVPGAGSGPGG